MFIILSSEFIVEIGDSILFSFSEFGKCILRGSNPRPSAHKTKTLTTVLRMQQRDNSVFIKLKTIDLISYCFLFKESQIFSKM
eukprot:TRINITY_DN12514_c0_g1_i1.p1 TRINITY_DN12514_c0_g1~~TRINITY_DN12514_c0_g1_i1.p1  ORF type:complete len:83 (-),score=2.32 TRINITY_DN12514_c0_g1_i1:22-270(-)